jgi:hypothetical protein
MNQIFFVFFSFRLKKFFELPWVAPPLSPEKLEFSSLANSDDVDFVTQMHNLIQQGQTLRCEHFNEI